MVHTQYTTNGAERKRNGKESVILTLLEKKTQNVVVKLFCNTFG